MRDLFILRFIEFGNVLALFPSIMRECPMQVEDWEGSYGVEGALSFRSLSQTINLILTDHFRS